MTRKQAKRRRTPMAGGFRVPQTALKRLSAFAVAGAGLWLAWHLTIDLLDRPIRSITIDGPFQRVSALQIEESISAELDDGFLTADLSDIQKRIVALPWIDQANVLRRWPDQLAIAVTEQVPAACWGERGLLNTRGELFVTDARHVPAELPRLSGPEDQAQAVAQRYLDVREKLIPIGLDVRRLNVDARGSWEMTLMNGIDIRLGRRDVDLRTQLFLDVVADVISSREPEIDFVDMRYVNGFTIGWKNGARSPVEDRRDADGKMMAGRVD